MSKTKKQRGFTIVELLIVIVVIGILAAISIVAYSGIQNRANDTAVQSDLNNFAKKVNIYQAENGSYPTSLSSTMDIRFSRSAYTTSINNIYYCADSSGSNFAVSATSKSGQAYVIGSAIALRQYVGSWSGTATCSANGFLTTDFRAHGYNTVAPNWQSWVAGA